MVQSGLGRCQPDSRTTGEAPRGSRSYFSLKMDALLRQLLDKAEADGGEAWLRQCLSLPGPRLLEDGEIDDPVPGASGVCSPQRLSGMLYSEEESAEPWSTDVARAEEISSEATVGRRQSKRKRGPKLMDSPAPPMLGGVGHGEPFFPDRSQRGVAMPAVGGRGRAARGAAAAGAGGGPSSCQQGKSSQKHSAPRSKGRGRGGAAAAPQPASQPAASPITVMCSSPSAAPGANRAQGLAGESITGAQFTSLSASLEQLIALIRGHTDPQQEGSGGYPPNAAGVWAAVSADTKATPLSPPITVQIAPDNINAPEKLSKECMPCLLSPLGFHVTNTLKEKIWRGEFMDLNLILPPSRDFYKYEKKEERAEEERRKPIIKSFYSWLQAFMIYSSILCEKFPEKSCLLFQHVDIILEAYRSFSGFAWLTYDEAFRQKLAVQPSLSWGAKDVGLWLNLFLPQRQPISRTTNTVSSAVATPSGYKKGLCFAFNDSQCKWLNSCKFKHECAFCAGAHPVAKCFRKLQSHPKEGFSKSNFSSDAGKNTSMAAGVPRQAEGSLVN